MTARSRHPASNEPPPSVPWQVELAAAVMCKRWKPSILWLLSTGCTRFGQLEKALPRVSAKVLAQQLRSLELDGLVERDHGEEHERSHYACYALTTHGMSLVAALTRLANWSETYYRDNPLAAPRYGLAHIVSSFDKTHRANTNGAG